MSLPATAMESLEAANAVPPAAAPVNVFGRQHFKSRREQIMQARGTMSMPTSPLGRDGVSMWEDVMSGGSPLTSVDQPLGASCVSAARAPSIDASQQQQRCYASPNYHNQPYPASFLPQPATERDLEAINLDAPVPSFLHSLMSPPSSTPGPPGHQIGSQASAGMSMPAGHHPAPFANFAPDWDESALHDNTSYGQTRVAQSQPLIMMKKKRAQVRIACTHCQKACKKCSNIRPCERCVKYGLPDCIDSTRKPRKTGVKRGPYKRRTSKVTIPDAVSEGHFIGHQQSQDSPASSHGHPTASGQLGSARIPLTQVGEEHLNIPQSSNSAPFRFYHPAQHGRTEAYPYGHAAYEHERAMNGPAQSSGVLPISGDNQPGGSSQYGIPPPRGATLGTAMSAALNGPRWVHGQRVYPSESMFRGNHHGEHHNLPQVLMPDTRRMPFPLSLGANGIEDPFSRAVSPIRQTDLPDHSTWQSPGPLPVYESTCPHDVNGTAGSSTTASSPAGWNHHNLSSAGSPGPREHAQSYPSEVLGLLPSGGQSKSQLGSLQIDVNRNVYQAPPATGSPFDLAPSSAVPPTQTDAGLAVPSASGSGHPFASDSPRPSVEAWPTKASSLNSFNPDQQSVTGAREAVAQQHHIAP